MGYALPARDREEVMVDLDKLKALADKWERNGNPDYCRENGSWACCADELRELIAELERDSGH